MAIFKEYSQLDEWYKINNFNASSFQKRNHCNLLSCNRCYGYVFRNLIFRVFFNMDSCFFSSLFRLFNAFTASSFLNVLHMLIDFGVMYTFTFLSILKCVGIACASHLYVSIYTVIQSVSSHADNASFWLLSTYNAFSSLAHFSLPHAWANWCVLWRSFFFLYQRTHQNLEYFLLGIHKSVLSISVFLWTQRKK